MTRLARIHLDPIGGIAGDMFVAAMTDAFPELVPRLMAELEKLQPSHRFPAAIRLLPHTDGALHGSRFHVEEPAHDQHMHVPHREIRATLLTAGLDPATLKHALALFELLAQAEGAVHGIGPEDVAFHEVGAWDSFVDFVAAAYLIAALDPRVWTVGPLPLGGGRVKVSHGVLPLPGPATAWLMSGLEVVDDGVPGERVTPTGATIARYLRDLYLKSGPDLGQAQAGPGPGLGLAPVSIAATGHGFGTMKLPGMPNLLRVLAFADSPSMPQPLDEEVATLEFEVDDQTAEDLAVALERLRGAAGVLDASQSAIVGKKGRLATRVHVLARPEAADAVADLCLAQTTTLGVRISRLWRRTVARASVDTAGEVRVKVAARPTGEMTAKAEMDDLARVPGGRRDREEARRRAESEALRNTAPHGRHPDD